MAATPRKNSTGWLLAGFFVGAAVFVVLLMSAYSWVAQKPLEEGMVISPIMTAIVFFGLAMSANRKHHVRPGVPEPAQVALREALDSSGLRRVKLHFGASGPSAVFPRPIALGYSIMISKRVFEDFSQEALLWSVRTDSLAAVRFVALATPLFYLAMFATMVGIALCERWKAPNAWYAAPFGLIVVSFALWGVADYAFQVMADRRFTRTEEDRRAAKEALSYPFFAQQDRKTDKWMYSRLELRGRAKRLGIELERGFKASESRLDVVDIEERPEGL